MFCSQKSGGLLLFFSSVKAKFKKSALILFSAAFLCISFAPKSNAATYDIEKIESRNAILIDAKTGMVLAEKDAYTPVPPASTTKILTTVVVLENSQDLQEKVTVGSEVNKFGPQNSLMGEKEGEELRVIDLLYGTMLPSGNDAALTLAIHIAGSMEKFADMMNAKVSQLGLSNAHFVTPHGLDAEGHLVSAHDMAMIARYAMQNDMFKEIVGTSYYDVPETNKQSSKQLKNSNRFLTRDDYKWSAVTGIKTGHTTPAQGCLVTSAEKDGKELIAVIFGDTSQGSERRWSESRDLLEFGFENLSTLPLSELNLPNLTVQVDEFSKRDKEQGVLELKIDTTNKEISGLIEDIEQIRSRPEILEITSATQTENLVAPITEGTVVGTAVIKLGETQLDVVELVATRTVPSTLDDKNIVSNFFSGISNNPESRISPVFIGLLIVIVVLLLLLIIIIINKHRLRALKNEHKRKRSNYYNYKIK